MEGIMRWMAVALGASLALAGCATSGDLEKLESRVAALEQSTARIDALEQKVDDVAAAADRATRAAAAAEASARDAATSADNAARKSDAIFKKSVSK
jgi:murein lipoprotein